jgi:hypothetical protein
VAYEGTVVGSFEAGAEAATGTLRLGRLARPFSNGQDQFYGLIDDLSLSSSELGRGVQLDFDEPSHGAATLSLGGSARLTTVTLEHRAELDELRLPTPGHRTKLTLPFAAGQVWMPIQGPNSALSHHDIAVFAIDFIRVEPGFVTDNPRRVPGGSHRASWGEPILAPAAGQVTSLVDTHENEAPSSNFVCVQHEAHEVSCLLHLQPGASARESTRVERGEALAQVGRSGAATVHLHFALSDLPESKTQDAEAPLVTIPAAFSDYFASTDFGRSWHRVDRGTPGPGEWVRR